MPASPTDSTSNATRASAPSVGAPADVSPPADAPTSDASGAPGEVSRSVASGRKDKGAACPTCGGTLQTYAGTAAHKLGSAWCAACGVRHHGLSS